MSYTTLTDNLKKLLFYSTTSQVAADELTAAIENAVTSSVLSTNVAINFYVATTGADSNPGTLASPFLTIQKAIDSVPKYINSPVTINVGAGNFAGAYIDGFTFARSPANTNGGYLQIIGTMALSTGLTGPNSGTATGGTPGNAASSSTNGTLVMTGAGWAVNELKGKMIQITSGTGASTTAWTVIVSNTSDTITVPGTWIAPTGTSVFTISDCASVVTNGVVSQAGPNSNAGSAIAGFRINGINNPNGVSNSTTSIAILNMAVNISATSTNIDARGSGTSVSIRYCQLLCSGSSSILTSFLQATLVFAACYIHSTSSTTTLCAFNTPNSSMSRCLINGGSISIRLANSTCVAFSLSQCTIENFAKAALSCNTVGLILSSNRIDGFGLAGTYGIVASNGAISGLSACTEFTTQFTLSDISNCGTAVHLEGPSMQVSASSAAMTGTGNTIGFSLNKGATMKLSAATTLTGTTEVVIDGVSTTMAAVRAATPKVIRDANYGTMIYE